MKTTIFNIVAATWLVAPASYAAQVYIPLGSEDSIAIVDTDRDAVTRRITGLPAVHGLAVTPDGSRLVAGSYVERPVGDEPPPKPEEMTEDEHASHHGPAAKAEAAPTVKSLSTVTILEIPEGNVVRRIDVPGAAHHVAVSPDGRLAVVTHPAQGTISAIDLSSYRVLETVATGPLPNYAAFSPDSSRVYVSNAGNGTVSDVDAGRWIVRRNLVVGQSPEHVVLSNDGARLYVNNVADGTVTVLDLDAGAEVRTISLGAELHGLALSQNGETLFVSVMGADHIAAVNLATRETRKESLAPAPYHLAVIEGTGKLYVSSASEPKVWVVDEETLAVRGEIAVGGKGHQMVQVN